MLSITAVSQKAKNKLSTGSALLVILDIMLPNNPVHLVYNNEDITWKGTLYQAFPMRIGNATEDSTGSDPALKLEVDNVGREFQYWIEEAKGGNGTEVILRIVNSENLNGEADLEEFYIVTQCKVNEKTVTFTLGSGYSSRSRCPCDRYMKNACRYKYKGLRCGYNGKLATCNHTLSDCRKHNNSKRFGGFVGIDQNGVYENNGH